MKMSVEFENGECVLSLVPDDEWEQKLLGAVAKGQDKLAATISYKPEGHFTYGKCAAVKIQLKAVFEQEPY